MDGVGISIIERPRPLPGHDTPNPTQHPYTLKCEEPVNGRAHATARRRSPPHSPGDHELRVGAFAFLELSER